MKKDWRIWSALMLLATSAATCLALQASAVAEPSPTVREYRLHMFDEPVRSLANRTIELMFNTARVERAGPVAALPKALTPLDFTYEAGGVTHRAEDVLEDTKTDGLLIIKNGRIVYERYLNRTDEKTHFNSYSMAKSFNSIMVGLALRDGRIHSVDDPITRYVPELKGTGYDGATLKNLLEMRSGVAWDDNFFAEGPARKAHVDSWVMEKARYTDAAAATRRAHPPGAVYEYNSLDAALVGLAVARATGMPVSRYLSERLWKPGGMESYGFYVIDGPPGIGREFTAGGFNATLRDYGRVGLMMLDRGRLNGRQILPAAYVAESTRPSTVTDKESDEPGLGYAYFWWPVLGGKAFTALGGEGQFLYVDPATRTVIVKMSHSPVGPDARASTAEALSFFAAASRWSGPK